MVSTDRTRGSAAAALLTPTSRETPGAQESYLGGRRSPPVPRILRLRFELSLGAAVALAAPGRRPLERRRHLVGAGRPRGDPGREVGGGSAVPGGNAAWLPTWTVFQHGAKPGRKSQLGGTTFTHWRAPGPELAELSLGGTEGQPGPGFWPGIHPEIFLAGLKRSFLSSKSFQHTPIWHSLSFKYAGSIIKCQGLGSSFLLSAILSSCRSL